MAVLPSICALIFILKILQTGECSEQAIFRRNEQKYLANHVIETKQAETELECGMYCTRHGSCASVNYKTSGIRKGLCELNNKTLQEAPDGDEKAHNPEFNHLAIIKPILSKTKTQQIAGKPSCKELLEDDGSLQSGVYYLRAKASAEKYPVYCQMTEISGCGPGGWTLVMKTNGDLNTFTYDSPYWTNKESYAVEDGLEGLTEKERKLASYWNTPFKKICLGMTVNGDTKWIMLDYEASSLYSLIADGNYRKTTTGRVAWKSLIEGSSLQQNCNEEGFSIAYNNLNVRIGYYANNQDRCTQADSCIGFGISYNACYVISNITCGNIAQCGSNDNGRKLTAAFGYILVQ